MNMIKSLKVRVFHYQEGKFKKVFSHSDLNLRMMDLDYFLSIGCELLSDKILLIQEENWNYKTNGGGK